MLEKPIASGSAAYAQEGIMRPAFVGATFLLLVLCVVLPNSAQMSTAVLMVVSFLLSLSIAKVSRQLLELGCLYLIGVAVTLFYLTVGLYKGAPLVAIQQVSIVYILTPLLWIYIAAALMQLLGIEKLIRWFVLLAFLCCFSIGIFFYLYIQFGSEAVSFFKEDANVDLTNGYAASTMFVYGSLIFICGGFFAVPDLIGNWRHRAALLVLLVIAALTSGRSALILSIPLGIALGLLIPAKPTHTDQRVRRNTFRAATIIFVSVSGAMVVLSYATDISISYVLEIFAEKLFSGGGSERSEQISALLNASMDANGFGSGHGVGIPYVRDDEYPWRYETVWVATIFRVGILGAIIYLLPFVWYLVKVAVLTRTGQLLPQQKFMFAGFVCAFLATNTNPYIESFVFQWMYVLPVVSLFTDSSTRKSDICHDSSGSMSQA